jgi:hypothetical protein
VKEIRIAQPPQYNRNIIESIVKHGGITPCKSTILFLLMVGLLMTDTETQF